MFSLSSLFFDIVPLFVFTILMNLGFHSLVCKHADRGRDLCECVGYVLRGAIQRPSSWLLGDHLVIVMCFHNVFVAK